MDDMQRLMDCGMSEDDAWFIRDDFLSDGDRDGLNAYIRDLERGKYCTREVVEEVLLEIGLEKISAEPDRA